jgi:hypothetical protein
MQTQDVIFGDRADFAIEAGVEPDLVPPSAVWGHMCVWCSGTSLGNIDDHYCHLGVGRNDFHWLAEHLDERWDETLSGMSDIEQWSLLRGNLYGLQGGGISVPKLVLSPDDVETDRNWQRYNKLEFLTNWGEQFDGYPAFLLAPPGESCRVLFQRPDGGTVQSVLVSRSAVIAASRDFVAWLDDRAKSLSGDS